MDTTRSSTAKQPEGNMQLVLEIVAADMAVIMAMVAAFALVLSAGALAAIGRW